MSCTRILVALVAFVLALALPVHAQSCGASVPCRTNSCGNNAGGNVEKCQPCRSGVCGCTPASSSRPTVMSDSENVNSAYACHSTFVSNSPNLVSNTICNSWVYQVNRYLSYPANPIYLHDTCVCAARDSAGNCAYERDCVDDRMGITSYYSAFPTRTYCEPRTTSNFLNVMQLIGSGTTVARTLACWFNPLPALMTSSTSATRFAYAYCQGSTTGFSRCNNAQVYTRFEYNALTQTMLNAQYMNAIGTLQMDSCECNVDAYWNPATRNAGCDLCSPTCDAETEYCSTGNVCLCRTGWVRDPVYNNTCVPRCDVQRAVSRGENPSFNIPYCDNKACLACNLASSLVQCDGAMNTCVCANTVNGVCPSAFLGSTMAICRQPEAPTWGINVCECTLDASGQCVLRGESRCNAFGTFTSIANMSEVCRVSNPLTYPVSVQVGSSLSSFPALIAQCTSPVPAPSVQGTLFTALCRHTSAICTGQGQRFARIAVNSQVNATFVIAAAMSFNDSCQCDAGRSGMQCENDCIATCDSASTYCTRNNTCVCRTGLVAMNTTQCDCPLSSVQFGPACTSCAQCTTTLPRSKCRGGLRGNGACYCDPAQYVLNANANACVCPSQRYGIDCSGTCPASCVSNARCDDGLYGTGQCVCNTNFTLSGTQCVCAPGRYGNQCQFQCPVCMANAQCNAGLSGNGACTCNTNFVLALPQQQCQCVPGRYGPLCASTCPNCVQVLNSTRATCADGQTGNGTCACGAGFIRTASSTCVCPPGTFGANCTTCPMCATNQRCDDGIQGNGSCVCNTGFVSFNSTLCVCPPNTFGTRCNGTCVNCRTAFDANSHCVDGQSGNGSCICNAPVFAPSSSSPACNCASLQQYGPTCNATCPVCDPHALCSNGVRGNGTCICQAPFVSSRTGCTCAPGVYGANCTSTCNYGTTQRNTSVCNDGITGTGVITCIFSFSLASGCRECISGYYGAYCNQTCPTSPSCAVSRPNSHCDDGRTGNGACLCDTAFVSNGSLCVCPSQRYGATCQFQCQATCPSRTRCNDGQMGDGSCRCVPALVHASETQYCDCATNWYGAMCDQACPVCGINALCLDGADGSGQCVCRNNVTFVNSTTFRGCDCVPGRYGANCTSTCPSSCPLNSHCSDGIEGTGACVCNAPRFVNSSTSGVCVCANAQAYGAFCNQTNTTPCVDPNSHRDTGQATSSGQCVCNTAFNLTSTGQCECTNRTAFGVNCMGQCPSACFDSRASCDRGVNGTGRCLCASFPFAPTLETQQQQQQQCTCAPGRLGASCQLQCPLHCTAHSQCRDGINATQAVCQCDAPLFVPRDNTTTPQCDCRPGYATATCMRPCDVCGANAHCDAGVNGTGTCLCDTNFIYNTTLQRCDCPRGKYGAYCNATCATCVNAYERCDEGMYGNGTCQCTYPHFERNASAMCQCQRGWYGDACDRACAPSACGTRRHCDDGRTGSGQCVCDAFTQSMPSCECVLGRWGDSCMNQCPACQQADVHAACHDGASGNGKCYCNGTGFATQYLDATQTRVQCTCAPGQYGESCQYTNPICSDALALATNGVCACVNQNVTQHVRVSTSMPCDCEPGYYGHACENACAYTSFPAHAVCVDGRNGTGEYVCPSNRFVRQNNQCVCLPGRYGSNCEFMCALCNDPYAVCADGITGSGQCVCPPQYIQASDDTCVCPPGRYGATCSGTCPASCPDRAYCLDGLHGNGQCICPSQYKTNLFNNGTLQSCTCPANIFGSTCRSVCPVCSDAHQHCDDDLTGSGACVCNAPLFRAAVGLNDTCECADQQYGPDCTQTCPACNDAHRQCNQGMRGNGTCICLPGLVEPNCDCPSGLFGSQCESTCPVCPANEQCDGGLRGTGQCVCTPGALRDPIRQTCECPTGRYGPQCETVCPVCPVRSSCRDGLSGDGVCVCDANMRRMQNGTCNCAPGNWSATCLQQCPVVCPTDSACSDGVFGSGECVCRAPFTMTPWNTCDCVPGYFGTTCTGECNDTTCQFNDSRSQCNNGRQGDGACVCIPPFVMNNRTGQCDCAENRFGPTCTGIATVCVDRVHSHETWGVQANGQCECNAGLIDLRAQHACECTYQANNTQCLCNATDVSSSSSLALQQPECDCFAGHYGATCNQSCSSTCPVHATCNDGMRGTGQCVCADAFIMTPQNTCVCPNQQFGTQCESTCTACVDTRQCDEGEFGTGQCACRDGLLENSAQNTSLPCVCANGQYGERCQYTCPLCSVRSQCDDGPHGTGQCWAKNENITQYSDGRFDCIALHYGEDCDRACDPNQCTDPRSVCDVGAHGTGQCVCAMPFVQSLDSTCDCPDTRYGPFCEYTYACPAHASPVEPRGVRSNGTCACDTGYLTSSTDTCYAPGEQCTQTNDTQYDAVTQRCMCTGGAQKYGKACAKQCDSSCSTGSHGICDAGYEEASGQCVCQSPFEMRRDTTNRTYCQCPLNTYGNACQYTCALCESPAICSQGEFGNGACVCPVPYIMRDGTCDCPIGWAGQQCNIPCPLCSDSRQVCTGGRALSQATCTCIPPYIANTNAQCDCAPGYYGPTCAPVAQSSCPAFSSLQDGILGSGQCVCETGLRARYIPGTQLLRSCECKDADHTWGYPACPYACKPCVSPAMCDGGLYGSGRCVCPFGMQLNSSDTARVTCTQIECARGTFGPTLCEGRCECNATGLVCDDARGVDSTGQCYVNSCQNGGIYNVATSSCQCTQHYIDVDCSVPACALGYLNQNTLQCVCDTGVSGIFCDYIDAANRTLAWNDTYAQRTLAQLYSPVSSDNVNMDNQTLANVLAMALSNSVSGLSNTQTAVAAATAGIATAGGVLLAVRATLVSAPAVTAGISGVTQLMQAVAGAQMTRQQAYFARRAAP